MDSYTFFVLCLNSCLFVMSRADTPATIIQINDDDVKSFKPELQAAESVHIQTLKDLNILPYVSGTKSVGGSFVVDKPSLAISAGVGAGRLLTVPVDILRLVEAFLRLKGELLDYFLAIYNDNWEVIRAVSNFLVSKLPKVNGFILAGIGVLRNFLEYAVQSFAQWSVSLPAINVAGFKSKVVQPHETYGVPSVANVVSFLDRYTNK